MASVATQRVQFSGNGRTEEREFDSILKASLSDEELAALLAGDSVTLEGGISVTVIREPVAPVPAMAKATRRPRPIVREVSDDQINWSPDTKGLYSLINGAPVRAAESFAIVREGHERWPLGICSDHYSVQSHLSTIESVKSYCADLVTPGPLYMAAHGYYVAHEYTIKHMRVAEIGDATISTTLVVVNDHTGKGANRSAMVIHIDGRAIGSVIRTRGLHVGAQPEIWHSQIESMTERAVIAQDAVLDLLRAAKAHTFTDEDRKTLVKRNIRVKGEPKTLLDAMLAWQHSKSENVTWGVWERRLDDTAVDALCEILGRATFGAAIDQAITPPNAEVRRHFGPRGPRLVQTGLMAPAAEMAVA